jgi:hypothetical protein
MLGFKSFEAAQHTLAGIELMHMHKKGQMVGEAGAEGPTRPNSSTHEPPNPRIHRPHTPLTENLRHIWTRH